MELSYPLTEPDSLDSTETLSNTTTATTTTIVYLDYVDDIIFSVRTGKYAVLPSTRHKLENIVHLHKLFLRIHLYSVLAHHNNHTQ